MIFPQIKKDSTGCSFFILSTREKSVNKLKFYPGIPDYIRSDYLIDSIHAQLLLPDRSGRQKFPSI